MLNSRVLIIDDDADLRALLKKHLNDVGCEVDEAEDGEIGATKALEQHYDLLILDINLPKKDGLEVCKIIRTHNSLIPILMLTAKKDEIDRVLGLELGGRVWLIFIVVEHTLGLSLEDPNGPTAASRQIWQLGCTE